LKRLTILGATGYTGTLICQLLEEKKIPFTAAVRSLEKLPFYNQLKASVKVDLANLNEITQLLKQTDILVNCVGPYSLFGPILMKELRKYPIYYLDLSGEQSFVKNSLDQHLPNSAYIIHSCSFESALVDLLAFNFLDSKKNYHLINSFYYFDSANPSRGTRFTMKVHGYFDQFAINHGQLIKITRPFALNSLNFPQLENLTSALFTPYPEVLFFHKNFQVQECGSFLIMDEAMIQFALARTNHAPPPLESVVAKLANTQLSGPAPEVRQKQFFRIFIMAEEAAGVKKLISLAGYDMYGITAKLAVQAAEFLLIGDKKLGQTVSPAEAFHADGLLQKITHDANLSSSSICL